MRSRVLKKIYLDSRRKQRMEVKDGMPDGDISGCIINAGDLVQYLARIDERQKKISKDVEDIKSKVYGNGNEGIIEEMTAIKTTLRNVKYGLTVGFTVIAIVISFLSFYT